MELKQAIQQVLDELPEDRLRQLLDYARYLAAAREAAEWEEAGLQEFAKLYEGEPEYTLADIKTSNEPT
jgi:hypothetical protein